MFQDFRWSFLKGVITNCFILICFSQHFKCPLMGTSIFNVKKNLLFFFFCHTRAWTQGLHLEPLHQPFSVMAIFKIGSHQLFAQTGFKPQSFLSLPPDQVGLQVWATRLSLIFKIIGTSGSTEEEIVSSHWYVKWDIAILWCWEKEKLLFLFIRLKNMTEFTLY
jgi:hypothetical protein